MNNHLDFTTYAMLLDYLTDMATKFKTTLAIITPTQSEVYTYHLYHVYCMKDVYSSKELLINALKSCYIGYNVQHTTYRGDDCYIFGKPKYDEFHFFRVWQDYDGWYCKCED